MSTTSVDVNEASSPICASQVKSDKTTSKDVRNDQEDSYNNCCNGSMLNRSRYGRKIKFKSLVNDIAELPQSLRMRGKRKHQNSTDSSNGSIEENNINNSINEMSDSVSTSNNIEEEPKSPNVVNNSIKCSWVLGQLAWARVGNFPFWPCVVTLDPALLIYHKLRGTNRSHILMIHVRYFGDKGRHSWVSANCMMEFTNLADFMKLSESLTIEMKKKDSKYAAAFVVKQGIKSKWESAIEEAVEVQLMTIEERVKAFAPKVKASKSKSIKLSTTDEKNKNIKRKHSIDQDEPDLKRAKQDNIVHNLEKSPCKPEVLKLKNLRASGNNKNDSKINSDTSSLPSNHKNTRNDSSKTDKNEEEEDGVFDIYYERNREMLEDEYPDASERDIKKYLRKTWDNMESSFRKKYRSYVTLDDNAHLKESFSDHEDEVSVETDTSVKESKKTKNKIDKDESFPSETKRSKRYKKYQPDATLDDTVHLKESSSDHEDEISVETDTSVKENKKTKGKIDKDESSPSETKRSRRYNLFKGMKQEKVCQICEKTGKLTRCKGPCYSYFHLSCVKPGESSPEHSIDESTNDKIFDDVNVIKKSINDEEENSGKIDELEDEMFKCIDCLSGVAPACFICNEREGDRIRCSVLACGKHYHSLCLKSWPQSHWQGGRLTCPYHLCHTCSSDNPQGSHSRAPNEKMARCVRCPSSYHTSTSCLPAGSVILTGSQIICPKHLKAPHPPLNAAWCFLCTRGGSLICCDTCPTSFHLECLGIDAPDGAFICEDCETGRLPLYGEIVWVKLGHYRWWPSRICYPQEIPENIEAIPHSPGKFCVMFLGSNDYYWVHRGRAFLYQDGDANIKPPMGKKSIMDDLYRIALQEANKMHQQLKVERSVIKEPKGLKPPLYVKLKVNKPVDNVKPAEVESIVACECDPGWDDPCAPGTDCLNRILLVECSPGICPAGPKCMNQSFVLRKYPAMEPFHTVGRGWGLKTLENIKTGQFVIEYVGEVIDEAEYKRRLYRKKELKNENFYFLTMDNNRTIDAEPKGNLSRFMNHSCAPNCETQKWTVNGDTRIGLFALRDIKSGEELTFNYNLASDGETRKKCLCGASNCSGFIGLKAQKQQLSTISSLLLKKPDKTKRKRSKKLTCWCCGEEISTLSKSVLCRRRTCSKKYHRTCVVIDDTESKFNCPWHRCLECDRRTSSHCSFCSTAFCQVHLEGNLFEHTEKGSMVCRIHENVDVQKSVEDEKEYSDNDNETDRESSSTSSNSPIVMEKIATREPSPRVSIVEIFPSSEESDESPNEEGKSNLETDFTYDKNSKATRIKTFHRLSLKLHNEENQAVELDNLTSSQLEAIIGGSLIK